MNVFRTHFFDKAVRKLAVSEVDLAALEQAIVADPETGDVIPGLGGARKIRFAMAGRGKRGGGRAIYVAVWVRDTAYLLFAYAKAHQADMTPAQRRMIGDAIEELTNE
ncbi:type II toxin-antitoxin system RelE/ParE family toxin [Caulobacter sp. S45]|uniref:type II toxin-antitoxin system RelE/ParE family toxin n=1 Tax=Caulobacter sp. S45 TaxID=1641861 RepID=UPI0015763A5B|nr:type II toxin-antitoxin system RelE/ParE family toxin [Caulobacter sp. S45]